VLIVEIRSEVVHPLDLAISLNASQNSFSKLTLVVRPPMTTERFGTRNFKGIALR
jgi:hypothetical protein